MLLEGIVKMIIGKPESIPTQRITFSHATPAKLWDACNKGLVEHFAEVRVLHNDKEILGFDRQRIGWNWHYIGYIGTDSTDWVELPLDAKLTVIGVSKPQSKQ